MNCRKVNSLLSAFIDGELTGNEQLQVRQHLRICAACAEEHDSLQQTKQILARLSTRDPDPILEDRILERIAQEAGRSVPKLDVKGWWLLLAEPDRAALRSGAVFAIFALAALLYLRLPSAVSVSNQPLIATRPASTPAPEFPAPMPLRDMLEIHNVGGASQPTSTGVVPVSNMSDGADP